VTTPLSTLIDGVLPGEAIAHTPLNGVIFSPRSGFVARIG